MSVSERRQERQLRAAKNQALFREINERIESLNEAFNDILPGSGEWVCECADQRCTERVEMSVAEYEGVRAAPNRFLIAPGDEHLLPDVETVVRRRESYWIVEKLGAAGELAKMTDPRTAATDR